MAVSLFTLNKGEVAWIVADGKRTPIYITGKKIRDGNAYFYFVYENDEDKDLGPKPWGMFVVSPGGRLEQSTHGEVEL